MKHTTLNLLQHLEATSIRLLSVGLLILGTFFLAMPTKAQTNTRPIKLQAKQESLPITERMVIDNQGQHLGKVRDLTLDIEKGRIVEIIVASGGFLGFGERIVGIPPGALKYDDESSNLRLNLNKEQFDKAPAITMSQWTEHCQSKVIATSYRYYGQEPYFAQDGQESISGNTAIEPLGYLQLSSKIVDMPVINLQKEKLGYIFGFILDPLNSLNSIVNVIVKRPGFLRTKSLIPATALTFSPKHDALYLDISVADFKKEPRFKWTYASGDTLQWSENTDPGFYNKRRGFFKQESYVNSTEATNINAKTRQLFEDGSNATYTPLKQGPSFNDRQITTKIKKSIQANTQLSEKAKSIEVGTLDGRITLRGDVNTAAEKTLIGELAAEVNTIENVSNLLKIQVPAVTN